MLEQISAHGSTSRLFRPAIGPARALRAGEAGRGGAARARPRARRQARLERGPVRARSRRRSRRSSAAAPELNRYPGRRRLPAARRRSRSSTASRLETSRSAAGADASSCTSRSPCSTRATRSSAAGRRSRATSSTRSSSARAATRVPLTRLPLRPRRAARRGHAADEARLRLQPEQPDRDDDHAAPSSTRFFERVPDHVLTVARRGVLRVRRRARLPGRDRGVPQARAAASLVLRTFSKIYGLAGLRVGYGDRPGRRRRRRSARCGNAFDINQTAQDAALASIGDEAEIARRRQLNAEGREAARARPARALGLDGRRARRRELRLRGDRASDAQPRSSKRCCARASSCARSRRFGAPGAIRVTVGTPEENDVFATALDACWRAREPPSTLIASRARCYGARP